MTVFRFALIAFLAAACALVRAFAQESAAGAAPGLEPTPEQAFSPAPEPVSARKEFDPAAALPSSAALLMPDLPPPVLDPDTEFSESLNSPDRPSPFYRRWLDSLFNLVAPGDPYTRDKLVFLLGTSVGYDTNVLYSATNRIGSPTYGVNAAVDYHFGSRRLKLDAKLIGGVTYFENRPGGSSDQNYALTLGLEYQLMRRLGISLNTYTAYLSQPSPQLIGGAFQYTGSYFYTNTELGLNYQMRPRFSLAFGYAVNGFKYDDEVINEGSGFFQQNFSLSGNWLVSPRTTLVLQYRYNPVTYYEAGLGSQGHFLLTGIRQSLTRRLNFNLLFGAEFRKLENPAPDSPPSYLGPFVEGSLVYQFAPRSALTGTMRLGTEPSGTSGVTIRQTFRAALDASHQLGSRVSLNAGISFERDNYDQPGVISDFTQDIYAATAAFRYEIALATFIVLRDDYLILESTIPNGSYTKNFVSLGLEVTF